MTDGIGDFFRCIQNRRRKSNSGFYGQKSLPKIPPRPIDVLRSIEPDQACTLTRELILKHGWNSTCYQLLNPGIEHWLSPQEDAVVGFVRSGGMAIVAGAPVCAESRLAEVVAEWEHFAAREGLEVCYFGAEARLKGCFAQSPLHAEVILGSQPEWHPGQFAQSVSSTASLRAQLSRAKAKGVSVREWGQAEAESNPRLIEVLHEWLDGRGLPTLHFLVEPETLGDLRDRRIFVAERFGVVVGFVTLCPIPAQRGWLTEQFVRAKNAPNGTVELILFASANAVAASGAQFLTMGIVPLLNFGQTSGGTEPLWLQLARTWAKAHYTRFYNFRGLAEFKAKFRPEAWTPVVVIIMDRKFRVRHLHAIARAFTQSAPELAVFRGGVRALKTEIGNLGRHFGRLKGRK